MPANGSAPVFARTIARTQAIHTPANPSAAAARQAADRGRSARAMRGAAMFMAVCALASVSGCKPAGSSGAAGGATRTDGAGNVDRRTVAMPLTVDPLKFSMGTVSPCDPPIVVKTTVTNNTAAPLTVARMVAGCACTTATLEGDRTIGPGESRTVEVTVDLVGTGGKSQRVDFVGPGGLLGDVRVDYEIVRPVTASVTVVEVDPATPVNPFTVSRTDGEPVKVLQLKPSIGAISVGADGGPVITLDGAAVERYATGEESAEDSTMTRDADRSWSAFYITLVTDHPSCPNTPVMVRRKR